MIFTKKIFPLLIFCGILVSTSYGLVAQDSTTRKTAQVKEKINVQKDTTRKTPPRFPIKKYTQNNYDELNTTYPIDAKLPSNVKSVVEYDAKSGNYLLRTFVGEMEISTPFMMTEKEYRVYSGKRSLQNYWKVKGAKSDLNNEDKFSVTDMKFNVGAADKIFGAGGVQIKTQGSAELIFGVKSNSIDNPALPITMRSHTTPQFDTKIQLNVTGNVGDKMNFGLNYNTESSFNFDQQLVKMAYKGKEDDIIKSIEAGNVSMQLNSSLISGSTALFGIKTELQFGRLNVSAIATQQKSESQTVSSKGGAQTTKFEISADNYDENRHFFLGHFFRDGYKSSMSKLPLISSGVTINRIEVWVTNKRGNFDQARNIVAFMDLGEPKTINRSYWKSPSTIANPSNDANQLYKEVLDSTQFKNQGNIRNIQLTNDLLSSKYAIDTINGGEDYEKIESARRLDPNEYTVNKALGFISLRSKLNPDEVLGVAYEYSKGGKVYQVGEFSTDAVAAPNALVVKLLKGTVQSPNLKIWKLMMKNVYDLGTMQIQPDNFKFNIVYRNDAVGTSLQYINEGLIKNQPLLRVMKLDSLDSKNARNPDGKFDFVEGYTILANTGRVFFPVLEPFGSDLTRAIGDTAISNHRYVFQELYDKTLIEAQQFSEKNKFKMVGEYKSSSGSEIRLNAMNVPRGSVTVSAGGKTLTENVDYTVDYTMGVVTILNQALIESGTKIDAKSESQSMFSNMQRKTLIGTHLEYKFNKDFSLGGTFMNLSEMPLTTKVNSGSEPLSNTIWGMNTSWRTESQWLTNVIDKLPFVNATKPSTLAVNAEFAQLIPGHSSVVNTPGSTGGLAYIDDFESTRTSIDIHYPINWYLASTPRMFAESDLSNDVNYGKNRALLSWYRVENTFFNADDKSTTIPAYIQNDLKMRSNHLTRKVLESEIFPKKSININIPPNLTVLNLSYYPQERGPYNLDVDPTSYSAGMDNTGLLYKPKSRWGGIMRKLDATDFESSNIEYIEFWMMDPFVYDNAVNPDTVYNKYKTGNGGYLYFNLGDISEDILKDGKKAFEHGLPIDGDVSKTEKTIWGAIPKTQSTVTAFDNAPGARQNQDVGLDGLSDANESLFPTYQNYVTAVNSKVTDSNAKNRMLADPFSPLKDPAGDNYHYFRGTDYDNAQTDVLTRYKYFNGTEGNSPDNVNQSISNSATSIPDMEDINGDNTLNEYDKYYQYKVLIKRDSMIVGSNYITDKITSNVALKDPSQGTVPVSWYQFKIPVRSFTDKVGTINSFKSIRFMRMFMTGFEKETHLRFATMELVRGEWRNYIKDLYTTTPTSNGTLDVQAVNIEVNSDKQPVNYILPPTILRTSDPGQPQLKQNEQSLALVVKNLAPGDARGVYKNVAYDMRQYKRLQMFVHAEKLKDDIANDQLQSNQLTCFIRIGSDMVNNYYEYEVPLTLTPEKQYIDGNPTDQNIVWNPDNKFDFSFDALTNAKLQRNLAAQSGAAKTNVAYTVYDPNRQNNKITILGNPSISDVQTILIGVRNGSSTVKSGEVWVNELRMSEFDESGGWAAMANVALGLSDIGSVNVSGRTETAGYGGIESNVTNRRKDDLYQMNFSTTMELGRFLPEKAKLQIPAYYSYTNETIAPKYNPFDQDVLFSDALNNASNASQRDSLKANAQTINTSNSFTISGAKLNLKSKTPQFYDPANVSVSYAISETNRQSPEIEKNYTKNQKAAVNYSFSFNPQPVEPLKNVKALDNAVFKIVKEFNFNYLPSSVSFNNNLNRQFTQTILRDLNKSESTGPMDLMYSKDFMWNRQFDIKYDLTRSIKLSFQTAMNANIAESKYTPEIGKQYYEKWKDTVTASILKLGTPYTYQQVFTASWAIPINKLPFLDWATANASYNSTYDWKRSAQISGASQLGNIASSQGAWQVDGQLNFETLYNKSKFLKEVNRRFAAQPTTKTKFQAKTYNQTVKLEKNKLLTINHRLGSEKLKFTAMDKSGKPILLSYKPRNVTSIDVTPNIDADSIILTMVTLNPDDQSSAQSTVEFAARTLMMVRRVSITYRESNSMVLPGFLKEPGFLGQGDLAPGYAYVFGFHDNNTIQNAKNHGWLNTDTLVVNPATTAFTSDLDIKASIEPFSGFKIDLSAKRYTATNTSIQYMFPDPIDPSVMPTTYTGSYNITLIALATAFKPIGTAQQNYNSETFNTFLSNRKIIKDRLDAQYQGKIYPNSGFFKDGNLGNTAFDSNTGYKLNSADVLIPSFLAAYTGQDVNSVGTSPFLSLLSMMPNWRVNYDGLSRNEWIKERFKSVSLTHAYTCKYSIGSYTSFSTWVPMDGSDNALGYIRDVQSQTGAALPSSKFDISSVSLSEQFSPLIGANAVLNNSVTTKMELRKQRNLSLNLTSSQLIEAGSDEYVVGFGYILKDFDVILKLKSDKQTQIKNDLKISADLSYKDIKTLLRKVDENLTQASSGNKLFTLKIMADYVFSSKMNIQIFFDQQTSSPLISSSYPVSSSNFGVSFKFMLTR